MVKKSKKKQRTFRDTFENIATSVTKTVGSPFASVFAILIILIWAVTGPIFNYSDTWQLVINTGTTIITFIMVFIIQLTQNKDSTAVQLKLNELIASNERASNRLIDIEDLSEEELETLKKFYVKLSRLAEKEDNIHASHSIDEAEENTQTKKRTAKQPNVAKR